MGGMTGVLGGASQTTPSHPEEGFLFLFGFSRNCHGGTGRGDFAKPQR